MTANIAVNKGLDDVDFRLQQILHEEILNQIKKVASSIIPSIPIVATSQNSHVTVRAISCTNTGLAEDFDTGANHLSNHVAEYALQLIQHDYTDMHITVFDHHTGASIEIIHKPQLSN